MKHKFSDIEDAFEFVSSAAPEMNFAALNLENGEIYYKSDMLDEEEFPEDIEESDGYILIPHKNDLDLGKNLVFDFVDEVIPEEGKVVEQFFRRSGAYSNFKALLGRIGKLEAWYEFENSATKKALREWCEENEIEVE
jgi:hypothetical protein